PQPRISAAGLGVGGIVQKAYSRWVFKQNCSIACAELARPLADRRDFDVLGLRQIAGRRECDYQRERLPSHFHCWILPFLRSLLIPLTKKTTSPKSEDRRGYEMLRSSKTCLTESEGQDARLLELLFIFANDFSRERFGLHEVKSRADCHPRPP